MESRQICLIILNRCLKEGIMGHIRTNRHMNGWLVQLSENTVFVKEDSYMVKVVFREDPRFSVESKNKVMDIVVSSLELLQSTKIIKRKDLDKKGLILSTSMSKQSSIVNKNLLSMVISADFNNVKNILSNSFSESKLEYSRDTKSVSFKVRDSIIYTAKDVDELQKLNRAVENDIKFAGTLLWLCKPAGSQIQNIMGKLTVVIKISEESELDLSGSISSDIYYIDGVMYIKLTHMDSESTDFCTKDTDSIKRHLKSKFQNT